MLTGEVPTQLGTMERLSVFSVGQNDLTGAIPSQIGQMRSLSRLLLPENRFDGFIPAEIGMLANLGKRRKDLISCMESVHVSHL